MISRSQLVLRFVAAGIFLAMGVWATIDGPWWVAVLGYAVGVMWLVLGVRAVRASRSEGRSSGPR